MLNIICNKFHKDNNTLKQPAEKKTCDPHWTWPASCYGPQSMTQITILSRCDKSVTAKCFLKGAISNISVALLTEQSFVRRGLLIYVSHFTYEH